MFSVMQLFLGVMISVNSTLILLHSSSLLSGSFHLTSIHLTSPLEMLPHLPDPRPLISQIRETCELAIESIIWQADEKRDTPLTFNPYASIDPAPASAYGDIDQLGSELADDLPIFQRLVKSFE